MELEYLHGVLVFRRMKMPLSVVALLAIATMAPAPTAANVQADISTCPSWLLLGPTPERNPAGLNGLTLNAVKTTPLAKGPEGLNAWVFTGENYVRITNDGQLNLKNDSFTIATFLYRDKSQDEVIVQWFGQTGVFALWENKIFVSIKAEKWVYTESGHPEAKSWQFVGVSFNHKTGDFMIWVDNSVYTSNKGMIGPMKISGDLYVGYRSVVQLFQGKLAGTTLMKCAISTDQIQALKNQIIAKATPAATKPADISKCPSWLLLGPTQERNPAGLNGLTLQTVKTTALTKGPEGLNAWVFTGENYVRITNDGQLNLKNDSFTIATFLYRDKSEDDPILEWSSHTGLFGLWNSKMFVYLKAEIPVHAEVGHPEDKSWHFVGMSFNHKTGDLLIWVDNRVYSRNKGMVGEMKMSGDLYIGYDSPRYIFRGKLAGTTLMKCATTEDQINLLRRLVIIRALDI